VALIALGLQDLEARLTRRAWLEALVIAILLGAVLRTLWAPGPGFKSGIDFSAKVLLETAIVLLGGSVSAATVLGAGPALLVGIAALVAVAIVGSYSLGRVFGLSHRMATLIGCGNAICGNSAIAAVAPVIGADSDDVAASIAFTAVLGVAVVLGLPVLSGLLGLSPRGFGVLAGLTVYAVPQVLAATAPVSSFSAQVGTVVKLARVLMLGPVVLILSLLSGRFAERGSGPKLHHLVPWFILGFLGLMTLRSCHGLPVAAVAPMSAAAQALTIVSMAALGLGVDARSIAGAGVRVASVVTFSIVGLGLAALLLIRVLGLH
jgi:uncharacterized integral membrane protein (TIGR00698 family)